MSDEIETIDRNQKSWAAWKREAERLQKIIDGMALAAMDSEPVIWNNGCNKSVPAALRYLAENQRPIGGESSFNTAHLYQLAREIELMAEAPLYRHAQPVPVVPNGLRLALSNAGIAAPESDEMLAATCEKHIQALVTWVKDRKPFQSAPVVPSFEEWLSAANRKPLGWVKDAMREAYDACRAAMLQELKKIAGTEAICRSDENVQVLHTKSPAQSDCCPAQNSVTPAQNQGWIPVSERMPEMGEHQCYVLAADFKNHYWPNIPNTQVGVYGDWFDDGNPTWDDGDGEDLHLKEVTHWMPLPSAPQEVNHG